MFAWLDRLFRFGSVGLLATATHALVYAVLADGGWIAPLGANLAGFAVAVTVSFLGHRHWTFAGRPARAGQWQRFVVAAIGSLALNSLGVWVVTELLALDPLWALLPMLFLVPAATYLLLSLWVFRQDGG